MTTLKLNNNRIISLPATLFTGLTVPLTNLDLSDQNDSSGTALGSNLRLSVTPSWASNTATVTTSASVPAPLAAMLGRHRRLRPQRYAPHSDRATRWDHDKWHPERHQCGPVPALRPHLARRHHRHRPRFPNGHLQPHPRRADRPASRHQHCRQLRSGHPHRARQHHRHPRPQRRFGHHANHQLPASRRF